MKHTYAKRTQILTLFTFFSLALGSQWTFGQIISEDFSTYSNLTGDCSTNFTTAPLHSFWRCGTANVSTSTDGSNKFVELPYNVSPNLRGYITGLNPNTTYLLTYKAKHNGAPHNKNLSFALRYTTNVANDNVDQTSLSTTKKYRKLGIINNNVFVSATNSSVPPISLKASWQEFNVIFTTATETSYVLNFSRGYNQNTDSDLTSASNVHIDDIEVREIAILKDNATTDLDLDSNWENDNKPSSVSHALITNKSDDSTDKELSDSLSAYNLYVEQETAITSTGDLTVANNLYFAKDITIKSNASNHGNLKLTGSSESYNSKTITYELFTPKTVRTGAFNASDLSNVDVKVGLITPPLVGMKFGEVWDANTDILTEWKYAQGGGNWKLFGPYENGTYTNYFSNGSVNGGDDKTNDATLVVPGKGYRTSLYEGKNPNGDPLTSDGLLEFTGDILTGDQSADVGSNSDGWDLIGNPYTTGLSLKQFVEDNSDNLDDLNTAITYWDNSNLEFVNIRQSDLITTDIIIPPGQAFFIKPASSITSVDFNSSQQQIQTGAGFNRSINTLEGFNLILSNTTASKSTKVYLNNSTTLGVDKGHEAAAIGLSTKGMGIYTLIADQTRTEALAIQSIPATDLENTTLKLGVNAGLGEHTLSLEGINLPENLNVYLTDLANGSQTLLNKYDYTFNVTENKLEGADRFLISFQSDALSTGNNSLERLQITAVQNTITVNGAIENNTALKVYDLQGRLVAQSALSNNNRQLSLTNSAGVYVVNLSNVQGSKTQKVILK